MRSRSDKELLKKVPPELRALARKLLPHLDVSGLPPDRAVAYVAAAAAAFEEVQRERDEEALPPVPVTPQDEVHIEQVERWLRPRAEALRSEVFGSPEPPFSSLAEAAIWITDEHARSREQERAVERYMGDCVNAMTCADVEGESPVDYHAFQIQVHPEEAHLRYIGVDGWVCGCGAMGSAKLTRLAWATEEMTRAAGWTESAQATTYLLLGVAAPIPHFTISTFVTRTGISEAPGASLRRREAVLAIRGSDFSYDELREIWARLRRQGIREKKPLSRKHAEVWRFVNARRALNMPWEQIREEWNSCHEEEDEEEDQYATIRGMQSACKRAEEKGLMAGEFFELVEEDDSNAPGEDRA
jgi:hypothetical protein